MNQNNSNKRILLCVAEGGALLTHRLNLAKTIMKQGHDLIVGANFDDEENRNIILKNHIKTHHIPYDRGGINPWRDFITILSLLKLLWVYRPDIIHNVAIKPCLYGAIAVYILQKIGFLKNSKIINAFGGMGYIFTQSKMGARDAKKRKILQILIIPLFKFFMCRENTLILVQNNDDANIFKERLKIPIEKIHIIKGAGVDLDKFTPQYMPDNQNFKIICLSRLLKDKGIVELCAAADILKAKGFGGDIYIYGDIDRQNPASLTMDEVKYYQKNSPDFLHWRGFQRDVAEVLKDCHIVVLPSYREGLPKSLLEGGASGKALIACDVEGCREICQHMHTGLLVEKGDATSLADAIDKLYGDKKLCGQLAQNARHLVECSFADTYINKKTLALYEKS